MQLLISPGAENEGYRVVFSLMQRCFSVSPCLSAATPAPRRQPFTVSFICQKHLTHGSGRLVRHSGLQPLPGGMAPAPKHARTGLMQGENWQLIRGRGEGEEKSWVNPSDSQGQGNPLLKLGEENGSPRRELVLPPASRPAPSALRPSPPLGGIRTAPDRPLLRSVPGAKELALPALLPRPPPFPSPPSQHPVKQ